MKALLLAAGFGRRLKPLTDTIPKCMVPIGGKPLLGHWIELLLNPIEEGKTRKAPIFEEVIINTHYLSHAVQTFIHSQKYRDSIRLIHEPKLLGTAGTLRANRSLMTNQCMFVAHADNVTRFNLQKFINCFKERPSQCIGTMMTFETTSPESCGIVETDDDGVLVGYHEKVRQPPSSLANAAVFLLEPSIFSILDQHQHATDFCAEVVPQLVGKLNTFHNGYYHRDIGTPASYEQALRDFNAYIKER